MSSWIWMNGVSAPLAENAIVPAFPGDERPAVKDLIAKHRESIDRLATELAEISDLYDKTKHDDLWILRFILSHKKKHSAALAAASYTLEFRKTHKLDEKDLRYSVPFTESVESQEIIDMMKYHDPDTFLWCLPNGAEGYLFLYSRYAGQDQNALAKNTPASHWLSFYVYFSEFAFQWCDYITRTTGRLTKNVRLVDFDGMSLLGLNSEIGRRDRNCMKVTEDVYPQLLQTVVICHAPSWIQVPWRVWKAFVPKRVTEKIDLLHPKTNTKERSRILKFISIDALPDRFGGKYSSWPIESHWPSK